MNEYRLNKMDAARHLLPEPWPENVKMLIAELRKALEVRNALTELMPFVLEDYYPDCATAEYKDAVIKAMMAVK